MASFGPRVKASCEGRLPIRRGNVSLNGGEKRTVERLTCVGREPSPLLLPTKGVFSLGARFKDECQEGER
jgi:hypothetical protein